MSAANAYYVDAPGFGDTVTLTQAYDHTSADGTTSLTGTATFTWQRIRLSESVAAPKCPLGDLDGITVGTAQFLAVASAVGLMPGWTLIFGPQDPIPDAFTSTYTPPDGPSTSSPQAASASLSASTVQAAPGRPILSLAQLAAFNTRSGGSGTNGIASFNGGEGGGADSGSVPITVTLVQEPRAATPSAPAVGPVYRVTIPLDCDLSGPRGGDPVGERAYVIYNGQQFPAPDEDGITGLYSLTQLPGQTFFRAANVVDVLLNDGDTMDSGMSPINYQRFAPTDSVVVDGSEGEITLPIDDPFPMVGQSLTTTDGDAGLTTTVQF